MLICVSEFICSSEQSWAAGDNSQKKYKIIQHQQPQQWSVQCTDTALLIHTGNNTIVDTSGVAGARQFSSSRCDPRRSVLGQSRRVCLFKTSDDSQWALISRDFLSSDWSVWPRLGLWLVGSGGAQSPGTVLPQGSSASSPAKFISLESFASATQHTEPGPGPRGLSLD